MDTTVTTIQLKGCKSHSVNLSGKAVKFIHGRGFPTSDQEIIDYCEGQPDIFDVLKAKRPAPEPEKKPKASKQVEVESDGDEESPPETPAPRGKRKRVKVEE